MNPVFSKFEEVGKEIIEEIKSLKARSDRSRVTGMGADGTDTHFIDKLAEDILLKHVEANDLPYNIISEEAGVVRRGFDENLIVDPVDGTYNAINGIPVYSISIAIGGRDTDSLTSGFVMNLGNGDVFTAEKGSGARLNGSPIQVCDRPRKIYGVNLSHEVDEISGRLINNARRTRVLGCASLEMCFVASGALDLLAYLGPHSMLRSVDVAAGAIIVKEAGGVTLNEKGGHFNVENNVRERFNMIAASRKSLLDGIL